MENKSIIEKGNHDILHEYLYANGDFVVDMIGGLLKDIIKRR